jgi:hypothetical protein
MTNGIIFTGMDSEQVLGRPAGAYRMRSWLEKNGYEIEVIDYFKLYTDKEIKKLCDKFVSNETVFVGISTTFFYSTNNINVLFQYIKKHYPHVKTIIGGTEGDLSGLDETSVDRYFWGFAEDAMLQFMDFQTGKILNDLNWFSYRGSLAINSEEGFKNDSSDLTIEWKKDDLLNKNLLPLEISRGCIFRCRFCQYPLLGKKKNDYIRYEDNLADEIKKNYELWGINNYSFSDDTFNDNIVKLEHVGNAVIKSGVKITYSCYLRADLLAAFPDMIPILAETGNVAGSFGIESLNETAKKSIGKGMDNEKQFDAIRKLKSLTPFWAFTGMIVGLPGESIEDLHKSQAWFIKQNGEVFNDWVWWPLVIRKNAVTRKSEFDLNYNKWGYEIKDNNAFFAKWKNQYMNYNEAVDLSGKFNSQTLKQKQLKIIIGSFGHWHVSDLIGSGYSIEQIINDEIAIEDYARLLEKDRKHIEEYKKLKLSSISLIKKIKNWIK